MTAAVIPTSSECLSLTDRVIDRSSSCSSLARFFLLQSAQAPSARHTQTLQTYLIIHTVHVCLFKKKCSSQVGSFDPQSADTGNL